MGYKEILVYLDPTDEAAERVRLAAQLAKAHGARLLAVDATGPRDAEGIDPTSPTHRMFDAAKKEAGVDGILSPIEAPGDGGAFGHCVDLIVAPAPGSAASAVIRRGVLDRALMESGAPVLIVPAEWTAGPVGQNVVIAWNGAREAVRAVHDAMPILKLAKKTTIFAFSSQPSALRASAQMLVGHLASHGVTAEHISDWTNTGDLTAVEALFASLDTQDADLIVAGAFGHSKLYEELFGGVSVDLMRQQSLPVLMSH
jgi:nucleotide-binding universal stress UspA family protein